MSSSVATPTVVQYDLVPRLLRVRSVTRLTPRMVRVTLGGDDLAGFREAAPADHVKVFFPEDPDGVPTMPKLGPEGLEPPAPGSPRPTFRDYTVREHRPADQEIDLDFVIHGHGPASTWAAQAKVGQTVGVLGPRGSVLVPTTLDWYLVAGDETALPAIARWLAAVPAGARVFAIVEVADAAEVRDLPSVADVTPTWLLRDGAEAGSTTLLLDTITALDLPSGPGFVWVAGEAGTLKPIRRYLRERGFGPDSADVDGYWKRGVENLDHHAADED